MELLGSPWPKYREIAAKNDIKVLRLPMIEGSCPETIEEAQHAIHIVNNEMNKGNNVLVHCRGGMDSYIFIYLESNICLLKV